MVPLFLTRVISDILVSATLCIILYDARSFTRYVAQAIPSDFIDQFELEVFKIYQHFDRLLNEQVPAHNVSTLVVPSLQGVCL